MDERGNRGDPGKGGGPGAVGTAYVKAQPGGPLRARAARNARWRPAGKRSQRERRHSCCLDGPGWSSVPRARNTSAAIAGVRQNRRS
jgi:hypothetical protein